MHHGHYHYIDVLYVRPTTTAIAEEQYENWIVFSLLLSFISAWCASRVTFCHTTDIHRRGSRIYRSKLFLQFSFVLCCCVSGAVLCRSIICIRASRKCITLYPNTEHRLAECMLSDAGDSLVGKLPWCARARSRQKSHRFIFVAVAVATTGENICCRRSIRSFNGRRSIFETRARIHQSDRSVRVQHTKEIIFIRSRSRASARFF